MQNEEELIITNYILVEVLLMALVMVEDLYCWVIEGMEFAGKFIRQCTICSFSIFN